MNRLKFSAADERRYTQIKPNPIFLQTKYNHVFHIITIHVPRLDSGLRRNDEEKNYPPHTTSSPATAPSSAIIMGAYVNRLFERSEFPIDAHNGEQHREPAVGGSLFFGFFLLAKQKKETRLSDETDGFHACANKPHLHTLLKLFGYFFLATQEKVSRLSGETDDFQSPSPLDCNSLNYNSSPSHHALHAWSHAPFCVLFHCLQPRYS